MKIITTFFLCFTIAFSLFGKGKAITIRLIDPVQERYLEDVEIYTAQNHVFIGKTNESGNFSIVENYLSIDLEFVKNGYENKKYRFTQTPKELEISLEMTVETRSAFNYSFQFVPTDSLNDLVQFPDKAAFYKDTTKTEIMRFIMNNLRYPEYAMEHTITGKVFMKFVVEKDGTITNIEIKKGVSPCLNQASIAVIEAFPKWTPAQKDGVPVRSFYMLPITYHLE